MKKLIDKEYYKIPKTAIDIFLRNCPGCLVKKRTSVKAKRNPFKMITTERVGERSQIDLIDFQRTPMHGYKWILRYIDVLSGFGVIKCLQNKQSDTVGRALIEIFCSHVIPTILQSDNGSEFICNCVNYVKKFLPTIHLIKGRPRHPQSQGAVERGNGTFKQRLSSWMSDNGGEAADWTIGASIVQMSINMTPHQGRDSAIPYETYLGEVRVNILDHIVPKHLIPTITTEIAYNGILELCTLLRKEENDLVGRKLPNLRCLIYTLNTIQLEEQ